MSDFWRSAARSKVGRAVLDLTPVGDALVGKAEIYARMTRGSDAMHVSGLDSHDCEVFKPFERFSIFPSEEFERLPPQFGPDEDREVYHQGLLERHLRHRAISRPAEVLVIEDAIVEFPSGAVMKNGKFVEEATLSIRQLLKPSLFLPMTRGQVTEVKGDAAMLPIQFWRSYGHWHTDVLPRWEALEATPLPPQVSLLFSDRLSEFHRATLNAANIPPERQRLLKDGRYRVERLWLPTRTMEFSNVHPRNYRWIRDQLTKSLDSSPPKRRIYVSRGDAKVRRILNEDDLFLALKRLGFERIVNTDYDWRGQAQNFRDAEVIVGPHGTNIANSVFCQPGAALLEIFGESVIDGTWSMASQVLGMKYGVVKDDLAGEHSVVEVPKVLRALQEIGVA